MEQPSYATEQVLTAKNRVRKPTIHGSKYPLIPIFSPPQKAYIACFIETDGSLGFKHYPRYKKMKCRVTFYNSDFELMSHLSQLLLRPAYSKKVKEGRKQMYQITVYGYRAVLRLLEQVLPYMIGHKKEMARAMVLYIRKLEMM